MTILPNSGAAGAEKSLVTPLRGPPSTLRHAFRPHLPPHDLNAIWITITHPALVARGSLDAQA